MKNVKVNILLALFAIVGLSLACTTDSDSGSGSGGYNRQRMVSQIIAKYRNNIILADRYNYNSDGRVTRVTTVVIEDSHEEVFSDCFYKYGLSNDLVIEDKYGTCMATLNNKGYLSTAYYERFDYTSEISYTYDLVGCLLSDLEVFDSETRRSMYTWSGGNLVEIVDIHEDRIVGRYYISYNNTSMDMVNLDLTMPMKGVVNGSFIYVGFEPYCGDGLCGKKSRNLITGWVHEDFYGNTTEYSLKWKYDEDGYPVEADMTRDGDEYCCVYIEYK